jgi:hypothetical protein
LRYSDGSMPSRTTWVISERGGGWRRAIMELGNGLHNFFQIFVLIQTVLRVDSLPESGWITRNSYSKLKQVHNVTSNS